MRCIANLATFTILRTEPTLHLWRHQPSRVQKEVLKHVLNAMEQSMRQKKLFPNTICIINLVWLVLIATKNLILPIFLMPVMDVSTVVNAIPQSKYRTRAMATRSRIITAPQKKHANFCFLHHF